MIDSLNKQDNSKIPSIATAGAGAVVGAVTTSGAAISVAGAGATGMTGYFTGFTILATQAACETAAAVGLGVVAAGPIVGGLLGYGLYRSVKTYRTKKRVMV